MRGRPRCLASGSVAEAAARRAAAATPTVLRGVQQPAASTHRLPLLRLPAACAGVGVVVRWRSQSCSPCMRPAHTSRRGGGRVAQAGPCTVQQGCPAETVDAVIIGPARRLSCGATRGWQDCRRARAARGDWRRRAASGGREEQVGLAGLHITIPLQQQCCSLRVVRPRRRCPSGLCDARHGGASDRIVLSGAQAPLPVLDDVQIADELASRFPARRQPPPLLRHR